ncbi:Wall-associated receptor kinase galacturonan-binding domain-containing protein [Dioscorea alata]|uniref:Wall-associated receptor kinase galacturonan-binding domain-containing protein n=1 Tax=Dioscorea alata TaxID=55571 RepID=A0ACB7UGB5_DIOAL|nr:Wall-associated receptor kinase galacturonan-binding domain-containing protein [Dioscorea alata]
MVCSSAAAAALLSAILLLILFFFGSSTLVYAAGDNYCAPSSCGNLTNIRYPFRLKDDPPNCGDPNYELTCDHLNRTILTLLSNNYYVTTITYYGDLISEYVEFDIQVKYVGMEKSNNGSCNHLPLPASPLTPSNLSRNQHYRVYYGWVTLVNCSKEVKNKSMHHYHNYYRAVPCLSHNNSFIYLIGGGYGSSYEVRNLMPSCRFLAMFPDNNYINWYSSKPIDISNFLGHGFTLNYYGFPRSNYIRYCLRKSLR